MAKKKEKAQLELPLTPQKTAADKVLQDITNLCVTIGDKSFLIRQTKSEITGLYAEIDKLRTELSALQASGSQANPAK